MYTQVWDAMTNQVSDKMIKRDEDGAFIPFDEGNRDYREYKQWLAEGNTPNPPASQPGSAPRVELPEPMDPAIKQYIDDQIDQLKGE